MKRFVGFIPAIAWALCILWIGAIPNLQPPIETELAIDLVGHFAMFFALGGLLAIAHRKARMRVPAAWLLVAGIALGAADELHQRTVPGRTSTVSDFFADAAGCVAGLLLTQRALDRRERRPSHSADETVRASNTIQEHRG